MISFHKKSFFLSFLFYFSITLIVLGIIQSIFGSLRLYNASEESYERLSPEKIYTVPEETQYIPKQTLFKEEKDIPYNVAKNQDSKETIQHNIPSKKFTTEGIIQHTRSIKKEKTENTITSPVTITIAPEKNTAPKGYKETIMTVVTGRYFRDALWQFPIIIDTERVEPRGQMYNESITLGSKIASTAEVSKVLVHEIGHMIDIYTFKKGLKKSDISEEFYTISWKDPTTIKAGVPQTSFVSGYAATNQYEDFAESFTMYIFHNKEFLKRAEKNEYLKRKYNFLKTRVF